MLCSVLAERRQWILEGFRSAGFKLIAGVVVEQDAIINQRMRRRDQRLRPAFEDLLEMKGAHTICASRTYPCMRCALSFYSDMLPVVAIRELSSAVVLVL